MILGRTDEYKRKLNRDDQRKPYLVACMLDTNSTTVHINGKTLQVL